MPKYFFHLHNDIDVPDEEGRDLPDLASARDCALANARFSAGQFIQDDGRFNPSHRIDIEDEQGKILDTVWFRDAVEIQDETGAVQ